MRSTAALAALLFAIPPSFAGEADAVLALAEDAGRWIAAQATAENGRAWPDDALAPDTVSLDLGSGVAGKIVFFVALYNATGKPEYFDAALAGADYLAARLDAMDVFEGDRRASLYAGLAGVLVALGNLQALETPPDRASQIDLLLRRHRHGVGFGRAGQLLLDWAVVDGNEVYWSPKFNDLLYGDAGTVLALSAHRTPNGTVLAKSGALRLAMRAVAADTGQYWPFRRDKDFNLPNFSHGTAGVAYTLATVAQGTAATGLADAAIAGADYLLSVAVRSTELTLMPYGWPEDHWAGVYDVGWAHGLAGDLLALTRLEQSGIRPDAVAGLKHAVLQTLRRSGLPGDPIEPLAMPATPHDLRFGRAGVLYALSAADPMGSAGLCHDLFEYLEKSAVRENGRAHWPFEAPAFMGGGRQAPTGLLHGAAGIGLALLEYHSALTGRDPYFDLPDLARAGR